MPLACFRNKPLEAQLEILTEAGGSFVPDFSGIRISLVRIFRYFLKMKRLPV